MGVYMQTIIVSADKAFAINTENITLVHFTINRSKSVNQRLDI